MVGWHHRINDHDLGQTPGVGDGQGGLECCCPWGLKELDTTEQLSPRRETFWLLVLWASESREETGVSTVQDADGFQTCGLTLPCTEPHFPNLEPFLSYFSERSCFCGVGMGCHLATPGGRGEQVVHIFHRLSISPIFCHLTLSLGVCAAPNS